MWQKVRLMRGPRSAGSLVFSDLFACTRFTSSAAGIGCEAYDELEERVVWKRDVLHRVPRERFTRMGASRRARRRHIDCLVRVLRDVVCACAVELVEHIIYWVL
jgi:hypothetical protein